MKNMFIGLKKEILKMMQNQSWSNLVLSLDDLYGKIWIVISMLIRSKSIHIDLSVGILFWKFVKSVQEE